jgi:hypothetical protein
VEDRPSNSNSWHEFCRVLSSSEDIVLDASEDAEVQALGFQYLTRFLAVGLRLCLEHADPDYPTFGRMVDITTPWGADCPDCLYLYATIGEGRRYRISGNLGTARHFDIQVMSGHYADGHVGQWESLGVRNLLDLDVDSDGSVEIVVDADAQPGNWLSTGRGAEFVLVRQYFSDWVHERPADLVIECLDSRFPAPPVRPEQITARLDRLSQWLTSGARCWAEWSAAVLAMPDNTLPTMTPPLEGRGQRGQSYGIGKFACRPDEAVIVEIPVPDCRYWSVSLLDRFWQTVDFATRQSSLNDSQAVPGSDGAVRAVIAHEDPGLANWLDPGGETQGTLFVRYLYPDSVRTPELRRVKLHELADALPAGEPLTTPEQRLVTLAARRRAAWRRYRR